MVYCQNTIESAGNGFFKFSTKSNWNDENKELN